jgi:uncharacterized membrane protein YphA (DoxX/SURF4 family)
MALDRTRAGLTILRVCLGLFFVFEGIGKLRWLGDTTILSGQLTSWAQSVSSGSISHWYLNRIAQPGVVYFARLVPIGELASGAALLAGFWTPIFAFIAFFMALNFQLASGALFKYSFLTSGYGLPVLGGTLALTLAGGSRRTKTAAPSRRTA